MAESKSANSGLRRLQAQVNGMHQGIDFDGTLLVTGVSPPAHPTTVVGWFEVVVAANGAVAKVPIYQ